MSITRKGDADSRVLYMHLSVIGIVSHGTANHGEPRHYCVQVVRFCGAGLLIQRP